MNQWDRYIENVMSGKIVVCNAVRQSVERHLYDLETANDRGLYFDVTEANRVIEYNQLMKHWKGKFANQVFYLSDWQAFCRANIFGWKWKSTKARRYRYAYIQVARKNGKTTDAASMALYMLIGDGEPGGEIYTAATKKDQAYIVLNDAKAMVKKSPILKEYIDVFRYNISCKELMSKMEPVCADDTKLDGLNVFVGIVDEYHAHKDDGVYSKLETGMGAREQPLLYIITTAGNDVNSACYEQYTYCKKILDGYSLDFVDDSYFVFICEIDENDDWKDESCWIKANPNLHISKNIDTMRDHCEKAKKMPSKINDFLQLHLNRWVQQAERWIPMDLWNDQAGEPIDETKLLGMPCHAALDLSSVSDFTSWTLLFPDENDSDIIHVLCRFWCPESMIYSDKNKYWKQYQSWEKQGYLVATPGECIEYPIVKKTVIEDCQKFHVMDMRIDRLFQGQQLAMELSEELPSAIEFGSMPMTFTGFAAPMLEFERRLTERKLHHGGNPVLRFCADNVVVKKDANNNMRPDKANSKGKIDGIVTIIMALDGLMRNPTPPKFECILV